jgi:fructose-bisphosphate aldolase class II
MTDESLGPGVPMLRAAELSSLGGKPAAIGAFNVNFWSQAEGILEGLRRADAPGILQASRGANKFQGGPDMIAQMVLAAVKNTGHPMPVCLHLDHGDEPAARDCIGKGFGSVMLDVSKLEYDANVAAVKAVVQLAHPKGISVEAELGHLAGVEEDVSSAHTTYADPFLVPNFFDKSGCDSLAIAYGTSHGPNKGAGLEKLAVHIVDQCYRAMAAFGQNRDRFLVSHGSSTVPQELIREINSFGGQMKDARGIPMDRIQAAIRAGIRKVNIDTDLRLGITATFRRYFAEHPGVEKRSDDLAGIKKALDENPAVMDPRDYFGHIDRARLRSDPKGTALEEPMLLVKERVAAHVEKLCRDFGSAGLAGNVEGHALERTASAYRP